MWSGTCAAIFLVGVFFSITSVTSQRDCRRPDIRYPTETAQHFVERLLKCRRVVVFSKTYCSYSRKAKDMLARYRLGHDKFQIIEVNTRLDGPYLLHYLQWKTGVATVPQVFVGGIFIGGGDDTVALERSGQLRTLLIATGAI